MREQQLAMALLAHAARHDTESVAATLAALTESEEFRLTHVISALLEEFQRGLELDGHEPEELAMWFAHQAEELAKREQPM